MSARAYLGLGGNVGDPPAAMAAALRAIDARADCRVVDVSRLYRTPPWGKTDQPWFFNAAAAVETELRPRQLLDLCLAAEASLHRQRLERWGPRTIDIDILDYGGERHQEEGLVLPHPRMGERAFVLVPLCDICPQLDVSGRTARERLDELDHRSILAVSRDGRWWEQ